MTHNISFDSRDRNVVAVVERTPSDGRMRTDVKRSYGIIHNHSLLRKNERPNTDEIQRLVKFIHLMCSFANSDCIFVSTGADSKLA